MELLSAIALLYFLPTLVAMGRGAGLSATLEVALWNLFLGWTLIGWAIAWSMAIHTAAA
jgi:hypothetical protein